MAAIAPQSSSTSSHRGVFEDGDGSALGAAFTGAGSGFGAGAGGGVDGAVAAVGSALGVPFSHAERKPTVMMMGVRGRSLDMG